MNCKKCGSILESNASFCQDCGTKVDGIVDNQATTKKKSKLPIIGIILGAILLLIIIVIVIIIVMISLIFKSTHTLVCTSDDKKVTIVYSDSELYSFESNDNTYNVSDEKYYFSHYTKDVYLKSFIENFESKTGGTCKIDYKVVTYNNSNTKTSKEIIGTVEGSSSFQNNTYLPYSLAVDTDETISNGDSIIFKLNDRDTLKLVKNGEDFDLYVNNKKSSEHPKLFNKEFSYAGVGVFGDYIIIQETGDIYNGKIYFYNSSGDIVKVLDELDEVNGMHPQHEYSSAYPYIYRVIEDKLIVIGRRIHYDNSNKKVEYIYGNKDLCEDSNASNDIIIEAKYNYNIKNGVIDFDNPTLTDIVYFDSVTCK